MSTLKHFVSQSEFNQSLGSAESLVVVHFSADWAPQCLQVTDVLEELSNEKICTKTQFIQVEAEELAETSMKYEIEAVPVVLIFFQGSLVDRIDGVQVAEIAKKVRHHSEKADGIITLGSVKPREDLDSRLKRLIDADEVIVFIKGTPEEPRCGFSRTLVGLLQDKNVRFSHFDILQDEEVRQGLKKFSNWPTFPQIYVKGSLIGGLDIVKELIENDEFESTFPIQEPLDQRLKSLVNKSKIMLFMKGDRGLPRCGFSRQIIDILNEKSLEYETFDILEDEEVRQGLKEFSQWKTYPQLYVNGELIGGLDIVRELDSSGELMDTINS